MMTGLEHRAIQKTGNSTILQRIAERDQTAVRDCLDAYGNLVWALARKFTATRAEAEAAAAEIFRDIWQQRARLARPARSMEEKLIAQVALRRLLKPVSLDGKKSAAANEQTAETGGISKSL
jgi:hypothetical protein